MKNYIIFIFVFLMLPLTGIAQEDDATKENDTVVKVKEKLERAAFESSFIIDNPTNVVLSKNALEAQMNHRFGVINFDQNNMAGIWGAANIRLGVAYGVHERVTLGFGTTKFDRLLDFNAKVALLRQTRSEKMPVSLTYFGNWTVNASSANQGNFPYSVADRWSFFNQLIVARRFSPEFSAEATISLSHYNVVENTMRNDMVAFSLAARYKITPNTALMVDYSQPLTEFMKDNPHPGLSFGVEFGTSAHAFQIFIANYNGIIPQQNYMFNSNDFFDGDILLGFTITRIYNF
jgi:hypothetical protein